MKNWFVPIVIRLLGWLPLSFGRALGALVGLMLWHANSRPAKITRENLHLCWPELSDQQREEMGRRSLMETGKTAPEAAAVWCRPASWLERRMLSVEGDELIHRHLAEGRGLLVLAPHLGNWEVVAPFLADYAPLTALYQPPSLPALDSLVLKGRSKANIDMAPTNRKGVAQLLKALKRGEIVGILPDQVPEVGNGAEVAPFFGQPALTMTLVHSLIQRTGCAVVSVYAERVPGGFKMVVLPADEEIYSEQPQASVAALNRSVEACVRRAPEQYQWEYKRLRRLPPEYPVHYRSTRKS
ncbi:lysophospholipid acyltransferase family protein [Marinimicrobium sp. ABcell2]|uniref:lysophospholipid acyltransferase family protein n=1 Tax=Marinimicrobium sp. ABcell2 TaxID=3069751 RepID=UPI0027B712C8|nr:lysophospholipid acyltransferase family protein [Marinimicrobium sp. ABcell2]MDQ2076810.1 lysophospholipid acyltransferase family protein [Marinimicrobium sp. ABcell2]